MLPPPSLHPSPSSFPPSIQQASQEKIQSIHPEEDTHQQEERDRRSSQKRNMVIREESGIVY
jgi:hypothetical protein